MMWKNLLSMAMFAIVVEASTASSFSNILQRRDAVRSEMMKRENNAAAADNSTTGSDKFRFLNDNTSKYRVTSLPEVPYDIGEMYAGNIPINRNDTNRTLFYVFQPTTGEPVDEITVWLNGGPGCSSMGGFFQEAGRFVWQPGVYSPQVNQYSWVNLTNMLWVDQPVGTGYSTGEVRAMSEEDIAKDFGDFFKNFQDIFGITKFKIYVTGESYAGRYIPYISADFINRNDTTNFNLSGALIYDGVIGAFQYTQTQVPLVPFVQANSILFNFNDTFMQSLESKHESCGYADVYNKYLTFPPPGNQPPAPEVKEDCLVYGTARNAAEAVNPCFDIYSINRQCPLLWDIKGQDTELAFLYPGSELYFNRSDVKAAFHAPQNADWSFCSGPVFKGNLTGGPEQNGDLSADPIQKVLPQVIEATNRVLVGNGDWDMIVLSNGTLLSIQNMTWNGQLGFQEAPSTPINIQLPDLQYAAVYGAHSEARPDGPQGIMGTQHYERGLMYVSSRQTGHMQPQFQPRLAYRHIQWLLGRIDTI